MTVAPWVCADRLKCRRGPAASQPGECPPTSGSRGTQTTTDRRTVSAGESLALGRGLRDSASRLAAPDRRSSVSLLVLGLGLSTEGKEQHEEPEPGGTQHGDYAGDEDDRGRAGGAERKDYRGGGAEG